jgi:hypothetical protein
LRDTYGPEAWRATVECGNLWVAQFEAMLGYDDALTSETPEVTERHLDKPQAVFWKILGPILLLIRTLRLCDVHCGLSERILLNFCIH